MPNFEPPIVVASTAALADIHVAELDEGTQAWVEAENTIYILKKALGLASAPPAIIVPNPGSPIAGAAQAGWERQPPGGGLLASLFVALAVDTVGTLGAPADAVIPFVLAEANRRVVLNATFSGAADRAGQTLFEIFIDGAPIAGELIESTAAMNIIGALTMRSAFLTAGLHTFGVRVTPQGAVTVTINAATQPTTDHLRGTGLVVTV